MYDEHVVHKVLDARPDRAHSLDMNAATRSAFPTLTLLVDNVVAARASKPQPTWLAKNPATLTAYPDHVYGVAPRAADKRKARRAAALELAALASDPVAAAELEAAYRG